jgi:hypothetical protein
VYTQETTVKVRDPSAVQVDVEDEHGQMTTILPTAATASSATLPSTSPPWSEGTRPPTVLARKAAGPITIACADCDPGEATLVAMDGHVAFEAPFTYLGHPWTKREMRIRFRDRRATSWATTTSYTAELSTPWTNVAEVKRVGTPDRGLGFKLLASAAILAGLGIFALQDGLSLHHTTTTAFGAVMIPLSIPLGAGGAWYFLAPPEEHVLFGGK